MKFPGYIRLGSLVVLYCALIAQQGVRAQTWNLNSNGNWGTAANWTPASVPNAVGANATLGSIITANRTITANVDATLGSLTINDNNSYTISRTSGSGTRILTFDSSTSAPAQINIQNSGSPTISTSGDRLRVALADNTVINHTGTGLFTISTIVQGSGSLSINGTGTTLLSGANTFSGGLDMNSGTLRIGNNAALGTGTATLSGGTLEADGGARSLSNALTIDGNFAVGGTNDLTFAGAASLGSSARTITTTNTGLTSFSGVVSGSGGIVKEGAGTMVLSGSNSFTGNTTVNAGTVRASSAGTAFGSNSRLTIANTAGAQVDLNNFNTTVGSLAGGGASGGNLSIGSATLTTGGDNSSSTYAGIIAGTGSLVKTGTGTLTLTGLNSYNGTTTISGGGVLSVSNLANGGSNSNIGSSSNSTANLVFDGGTLRYTGTGSTSDRAFTLGANGGTIDAVGTGALNLNQTAGLAYSGGGNRTLTLTGTSTAANNLSADIANASPTSITSIVKDGTGTWRISGDNTYTGSLTVRNGLMEMNSNTINGAVPEQAQLIVGDGVGAALSAIARNLQEGQVGNNSTVTVYSDGWFDINADAYANKGGDPIWREETIGQINLYGGRITTGGNGSLNINATNAGATIASFASSQTALIDATGGQVALNGSRTISVQDGSAAVDLEIRGPISNSVNGSGSSSITKTGDGRLAFTGTGANSYTGPTTINGGTLEVAKTSGVTSIASSSVVVNSGGTLLWGASDQINNSAAITLNGGTLTTGTGVGYSEQVGTLTLSSSSTINLGTAAHMLQFADSSALAWTGTLTIYGWTGIAGTSGTQGQIYVGTNLSGLTASQLASVNFDGFGPGAMLLTSGELVPIPIPDAPTVLAALALGGLFAWRERRRIASHLAPLVGRFSGFFARGARKSPAFTVPLVAGNESGRVSERKLLALLAVGVVALSVLLAYVLPTNERAGVDAERKLPPANSPINLANPVRQ